MESAPAQRRCCLRLLRIRQNCRKQTHGASSSAATCQPISTVYSQPLPPPRSDQRPCQDVHMEEELPAQENPERHLQDGAEAYMDLDNQVDPETGERAQG